MSALADGAREAVLNAVWAQWAALNPRLLQQAGASPPGSILDPEALVLASLALWDEERRLVDVLAWWAEKGAVLMSLRRLESLRRLFPDAISSRMPAFARWARDAGDTRWKQEGAAGELELPVRSGKGPAELELVGPETLLLKLRAGFGVSAKPDVFCHLLALDGQGATSKEIARAVAYADKNVRHAARELVLGGFLEERESFPVEYAARPGLARALIELLSTVPRPVEAVPRWINWGAVNGFLLHIASWEAAAPGTPYLLSSRARALFGEYRWAFPPPDLQLPDPAHYPGERYLEAFSETVDRIANWIGTQG